MSTTPVELVPGWSDIPPIHELLRHLNTEAKCLFYAGVPTTERYTPLAHVSMRLKKANAFAVERGRDRFNIHSIARSMGGVLLDTNRLSTVLDDGSEAPYDPEVKKIDSPRTKAATALAGNNLQASITHAYPLRLLFGERLERELNGHGSTTPDPIKTRVALLKALLRAHDSSTSPFLRLDVQEMVTADCDITNPIVNDHLRRLRAAGLITTIGRTKLQFSSPNSYKPLPVDPELLFRDVIEIIDGIEARSPEIIEHGTHFASTILDRPNAIPQLVRRSFTSTKHTDKAPTRSD